MNNKIEQPPAHEREPTAYPTLEIDYEYYEQYLEDSDLSDQQKQELIATIASIMFAFVDMGFGINVMQKPIEEGDILPENTPHLTADLIYSEHSKQHDEKDVIGYAIAGSEES